jgi:acetylornithine deacetylase
MNIENRVIENIDKNKDGIVKFLRELISFPSVTGNELKIQQFIAKKLKEMNLKIDMWEPNHSELRKHPAYVPVKNGYTNRPNLVGIYKGYGNGKSLLFNGHVDVIPAKPLSAWNHNP